MTLGVCLVQSAANTRLTCARGQPKQPKCQCAKVAKVHTAAAISERQESWNALCIFMPLLRLKYCHTAALVMYFQSSIVPIDDSNESEHILVHIQQQPVALFSLRVH